MWILSLQNGSHLRVFRRAEYVRALLEEEITDMFEKSLVQLMKAMPLPPPSQGNVYTVQSTGWPVSVLLRCLTKQCRELLDKKLKTASPISLSDVSEIGPLMSGLLIVGRLAWLLKIRGRFIEEALVQASVRSSQNKQGSSSAIDSSINSSNADLSSEEQLLSAFEIADTDGDGIVTNAEAIEAIQVFIGSTIDVNVPLNICILSVSILILQRVCTYM